MTFFDRFRSDVKGFCVKLSLTTGIKPDILEEAFWNEKDRIEIFQRVTFRSEASDEIERINSIIAQEKKIISDLIGRNIPDDSVLERMPVKDLKEVARNNSVKIGRDKKKDIIISNLRSARDGIEISGKRRPLSPEVLEKLPRPKDFLTGKPLEIDTTTGLIDNKLCQWRKEPFICCGITAKQSHELCSFKTCKTHILQGANRIEGTCEKKGILCKGPASFTDPQNPKKRYCSVHRESHFTNPIEDKRACVICIQIRTSLLEKPGDSWKSCSIVRGGFFDPNDPSVLFCFEHAPPNAESNTKKCPGPDCNTRGSFRDEKGIDWCEKHRIGKETKSINRTCEGCKKKQPSKGIFEEGIIRWCNDCGPEDSVNLITRKCTFEDGNGPCGTIASFGEKVPNRCAKHREGLKDLIHRKCLECHTRAQFNFEGEPPRWCSAHRPDNMMVNVVSKKCIESNCKKRAAYGFKNETHCGEHALVEMKRIYANYCTFQGCKTHATYRFPGKKCDRCGLHREGRISLKTCEICVSEHVSGKPSKLTVSEFGFPGDVHPTRCEDHKLDEKGERVDIAHRKCELCEKRASYGYIGYAPIRCKDHVNSEDIVPEPRKKCIDCKLKRRIGIASWGKNTKERCQQHKLDDDQSFAKKRCISCFDPCRPDLDICQPCEMRGVRVKLYKQNKVKDYLIKNGLVPYSIDKQITESKCSTSRPDFVFIGKNDSVVIVEVDENEHRNYKCEDVRMRNIGEALQRQISWIRFNPDTNERQAFETLLFTVREALSNETPIPKGVAYSVQYLFYKNRDSSIQYIQ